MKQYEFRQCAREECRFRFPVLAGSVRANLCPSCGSDTRPVGVPVTGDEKQTPRLTRPTIEGLLDNIRSIHNVGSMFRTADGAGLAHLHLCGMTATPAHVRLGKAALGAQEKVPWSYGSNGLETAEALKEQGCHLWAIEAAENARPFFAATPSMTHSRLVVIVGNENAGVDPGILHICDRVLSLPMYGLKKSLNVAVAFGIVSYHLCYAEQMQLENEHT